MSHNLVFIKGKKWLDFPYQTSSDLASEVLKTPSREKKLELIREDMKTREWDGDLIEEFIETIERNLEDQYRLEMT